MLLLVDKGAIPCPFPIHGIRLMHVCIMAVLCTVYCVREASMNKNAWATFMDQVNSFEWTIFRLSYFDNDMCLGMNTTWTANECTVRYVRCVGGRRCQGVCALRKIKGIVKLGLGYIAITLTKRNRSISKLNFEWTAFQWSFWIGRHRNCARLQLKAFHPILHTNNIKLLQNTSVIHI